ncbi:small-conductance mechanosensitive channel [Amphiplicatus metriothermophilus]|nr:small-conductance mechanosensitive channel [Amphiplicatus metriothermophilus]
MSDMSIKPPVWFWVVAAAAIVWTLIGVASYFMDVTMSEETLAKMPETQREIYETRPSWIVGLYAVAVFSAFAGAVFLALKKRWATPLFGVSLVAVVAQMGYVLFGMKVIATLGASAAIFPAVIVIIGAFLFWFSMRAKARGWLR